MSVSALNQCPCEPASADVLYTLEPLRSDGQSALDCNDISGLHSVKLSQLLLGWDNDEYDTELITSASLFDHPFEAIPAGAKLIEASFTVFTDEAKEPSSFTIKPPALLEAHPPKLRKKLMAWAKKRHFAAIVQPAQLALAILVAGLDPILPDANDGHDDDDYSNTIPAPLVTALETS